MDEERYRRVRLLGRGAMGEVWLAEDTLLHRQVALKSLSSVLPATAADQNRMMREARLAARLNHPNAVALYDVVVRGATAYLVMEYVPGTSLADRIAEAGRLSVEETARIGSAVADALDEAHRLGIVHRDVKPANILITERGVPKLADFGIARLDVDEHTSTGLMIGTPGYLSPERARGATADARSDIWALGVTLFAAVDGQAPFVEPGDDAVTAVGRIATATNVPVPVHAGRLTPALLAMLSLDPAQRPTASRAAELLRSAPPTTERTNLGLSIFDAPVANQPTAPVPLPVLPVAPQPGAAPLAGEWTTPLPQSPGRARRRRRGALIAGAAALVVAGGAVAAAIALNGDSSGTPKPGPTSPTSSVTTSSPPTSSSPATGVPYAAPGGITVRAPANWTRDDSAGIANIRDYVAPGQDVQHGTYFRIGIGNPSSGTIQAEAQGAENCLTSGRCGLHRVDIVARRFVPFLHTTAAEIEYTATNGAGVQRHGIERIWVANGITREIVLSTPVSAWVRYRPVYDELVASATVS